MHHHYHLVLGVLVVQVLQMVFLAAVVVAAAACQLKVIPSSAAVPSLLYLVAAGQMANDDQLFGVSYPFLTVDEDGMSDAEDQQWQYLESGSVDLGMVAPVSMNRKHLVG